MKDTIERQAAIAALKSLEFCHYMEFGEYIGEDTREVRLIRAEKAQDAIQNLPSAQPEQRPLTEDNYAYCAECDLEVKCLSCGHHIAERPFEVYCNIMCKWVNEKDYCTMFEAGQEKIRKGDGE